MARVSTYLNFPHHTEEAFNFYKTVFNTEFNEPGFRRFKDMPPMEGMPPLDEATGNLVMHVELPILSGHVIMGTDAPEGMGFKVVVGNNTHINLETDSKEETKRLFDALSQGGTVTQDLQEAFWGAYFGACVDKYGISWMFNCNTN